MAPTHLPNHGCFPPRPRHRTHSARGGGRAGCSPVPPPPNPLHLLLLFLGTLRTIHVALQPGRKLVPPPPCPPRPSGQNRLGHSPCPGRLGLKGRACPLCCLLPPQDAPSRPSLPRHTLLLYPRGAPPAPLPHTFQKPPPHPPKVPPPALPPAPRRPPSSPHRPTRPHLSPSCPPPPDTPSHAPAEWPGEEIRRRETVPAGPVASHVGRRWGGRIARAHCVVGGDQAGRTHAADTGETPRPCRTARQA